MSQKVLLLSTFCDIQICFPEMGSQGISFFYMSLLSFKKIYYHLSGYKYLHDSVEHLPSNCKALSSNPSPEKEEDITVLLCHLYFTALLFMPACMIYHCCLAHFL
jgi:hypothetical protein